MYKVISHIETKNGGGYWMRVGTAFDNKDASINVYLDAVPKTHQFQLREFTAEDFAKKAKFERSAMPAQQPQQPQTANDSLPF
jgi:hypothetical protein